MLRQLCERTVEIKVLSLGMVYIGELQDQEEPQLLSEPEVLNPGENYRLPIVTAVSAHITLNETAVTFWSSFHCILSHCLGNIQSEDFLFFYFFHARLI